MKKQQPARPVRGLGLSSGGLDSILSALVLKQQGIEVTWVAFETPFFSSDAAQKASGQTGIPLIVEDITGSYLEMLAAPKGGYGKYMNPCMDCHTLMFSKAGDIMTRQKFDFLFSGEVLGQRPKSQTKNSLRYVEKNSGYQGRILRPLSAGLLEETIMEKEGLVDRNRLCSISGRSRKEQIRMAGEFGVKTYPAPAGGCLLTDPNFSRRLKDLMYVQKTMDVTSLNLLKYGRHFRLDPLSKIIVGRSESDNTHITRLYDSTRDVLVKHSVLPGPDVLLIGAQSEKAIETAAMMCVAYSKANGEKKGQVTITTPEGSLELTVAVHDPQIFKALII